ncbi:extensin family protein [Sphingomonas sp. 8AM]|uniref:extensin family protein n=1 Tax=Sphingomonas sp. 8AM TaxID=2653170 RepID=UPI0012EF6A0B|nr:extensin family protein [Sphingomonas sp. 8AM]VXC81225.1 Extensin [Sphingomonas sp. 8AM]
MRSWRNRPSRALLPALLLVGCGRAERPAAPTQRARVDLPSARETRQCFADLRALGVDFQPLPDKDNGGGCALVGTVKLLDIGVPTANLGAVRCGEARAYAAWARNGVAPAAYQILGSELSRVVSMGSYACRNTVGTSGPARRSGHATANAIDIGAFELKDGRRISILRDWNSSDPAVRDFLKVVHASACRRFGTVLSPDYNAVHRDHLHLEDDDARFCR